MEEQELKTNAAWDAEDQERFGGTDVEYVSEVIPVDADVRKPKIPTRRAASDDCLVYPDKKRIEKSDGTVEIIQGEGVAFHIGEWVEFLPLLSMLQYLELGKIADEDADVTEKNKGLDAICESLSKKIVDWNWTDVWGDLYPKPFRNPAAIRALEDDELMYLISLLSSGETEAERGNA